MSAYQEKNKQNKKQLSALTSWDALTSGYLKLLFFILPLCFHNGYFDITETKSLAFYSLSSVYILCFLGYVSVKLFRRKKGEVIGKAYCKPQALDIAFLCFLLFAFISTIFAMHPASAWLGRESRYQGFLTILLYGILYYLISKANIKQSNFILPAAIAFSLVSLLAILHGFHVDVFGFHQNIGADNEKIFISTIGNINFYSSYMVLLFPFLICGYCQSHEKLSRWIYTAVLILGSCGILLTASESFAVGYVVAMALVPLFLSNTQELKRFLQASMLNIVVMQIYKWLYLRYGTGQYEISRLLCILTHPLVAILSFLLSFGAYWLLTKQENRQKLFKIIYLSLLLAATLLLLLGFLLCNTLWAEKDLGVLDMYFKITDSWGTYRGQIWKFCLQKYKELPLRQKLFGIGPENLYLVTRDFPRFTNLHLDAAHNEYLQHLMTIGLFGLLSYVAILGSTVFLFLKRLRKNPLAIGLMTGLIGFWIQAVVNIAQPFTTPLMYIFVACIASLYHTEQTKSMK